MIKSKKRVYEGKVVNIDQLSMDFDGNKTTYELIGFNVVTGVSALPITHKGEVVLIQHYQVGLDDTGWSLVTGGLERGEKPEERMQLELMEEIGMKAATLTLMSRYHLLPSYIGGEPGYLFLASGLEPLKKEGDEEYDIEVLTLSLEEALDKVKKGEIADIRTCHALLYYEQFMR